jgi:hypothetical protein
VDSYDLCIIDSAKENWSVACVRRNGVYQDNSGCIYGRATTRVSVCCTLYELVNTNHDQWNVGVGRYKILLAYSVALLPCWRLMNHWIKPN